MGVGVSGRCGGVGEGSGVASLAVTVVGGVAWFRRHAAKSDP